MVFFRPSLFLSTFVVLFLFIYLRPPFTYAIFQETGLIDQIAEVSIDSSTCDIVYVPNNPNPNYACASHTFFLSTNVTRIPSLYVQWYYSSSVVTSNGTGCGSIQIDCSSYCGGSSIIIPFSTNYYILFPCACTHGIPYTQNITVRVLSPFTNTSGNALPYPPDCGSLPTGTSKIIYSETDTLPSVPNTDDKDDTTSDDDEIQRIYGAPLAAVVTVAVLTTFILFGTIRGVIYYQQKQHDKLYPKEEKQSSSSSLTFSSTSSTPSATTATKIQPLPDLRDVTDHKIEDKGTMLPRASPPQSTINYKPLKSSLKLRSNVSSEGVTSTTTGTGSTIEGGVGMV